MVTRACGAVRRRVRIGQVLPMRDSNYKQASFNAQFEGPWLSLELQMGAQGLCPGEDKIRRVKVRRWHRPAVLAFHAHIYTSLTPTQQLPENWILYTLHVGQRRKVPPPERTTLVYCTHAPLNHQIESGRDNVGLYSVCDPAADQRRLSASKRLCRMSISSSSCCCGGGKSTGAAGAEGGPGRR